MGEDGLTFGDADPRFQPGTELGDLLEEHERSLGYWYPTDNEDNSEKENQIKKFFEVVSISKYIWAYSKRREEQVSIIWREDTSCKSCHWNLKIKKKITRCQLCGVG